MKAYCHVSELIYICLIYVVDCSMDRKANTSSIIAVADKMS